MLVRIFLKLIIQPARWYHYQRGRVNRPKKKRTEKNEKSLRNLGMLGQMRLG